MCQSWQFAEYIRQNDVIAVTVAALFKQQQQLAVCVTPHSCAYSETCLIWLNSRSAFVQKMS